MEKDERKVDMISLFPGSVFDPHLTRKSLCARANMLLWEEAEQRGHSLWYSATDMDLCRQLVRKNWSDLTEKDIHIIEMLALKYSDEPAEADLAPDRVLN